MFALIPCFVAQELLLPQGVGTNKGPLNNVNFKPKPNRTAVSTPPLVNPQTRPHGPSPSARTRELKTIPLKCINSFCRHILNLNTFSRKPALLLPRPRERQHIDSCSFFVILAVRVVGYSQRNNWGDVHPEFLKLLATSIRSLLFLANPHNPHTAQNAVTKTFNHPPLLGDSNTRIPCRHLPETEPTVPTATTISCHQQHSRERLPSTNTIGQASAV